MSHVFKLVRSVLKSSYLLLPGGCKQREGRTYGCHSHHVHDWSDFVLFASATNETMLSRRIDIIHFSEIIDLDLAEGLTIECAALCNPWDHHKSSMSCLSSDQPQLIFY